MAAPRRLGMLGTVAAVLLIALAVVGFVAATQHAEPARACRGTSVTGAPDASSAEGAIAAYAETGSVPAALPAEVPASGWLRREGNMFEHAVADRRVVQLDVAPVGGRWVVTGYWVCTPIDEPA